MAIGSNDDALAAVVEQIVHVHGANEHVLEQQ